MLRSNYSFPCCNDEPPSRDDMERRTCDDSTAAQNGISCTDRTAYGVASVAFSNMNNLLLGVMQGAGHSGTLWALMSSIILDNMDETQGAEFHSPYPNRPGCQRTGEAFVDDTALWILRMGLMFMMLTNLMQQSAQLWARLIHVTGGALNLLKCFWCMEFSGTILTLESRACAKYRPTTPLSMSPRVMILHAPKAFNELR
jgi:hypothetical protein